MGLYAAESIVIIQITHRCDGETSPEPRIAVVELIVNPRKGVNAQQSREEQRER
jgi:hypothetical protein